MKHKPGLEGTNINPNAAKLDQAAIDNYTRHVVEEPADQEYLHPGSDFASFRKASGLFPQMASGDSMGSLRSWEENPLASEPKDYDPFRSSTLARIRDRASDPQIDGESKYPFFEAPFRTLAVDWRKVSETDLYAVSLKMNSALTDNVVSKADASIDEDWFTNTDNRQKDRGLSLKNLRDAESRMFNESGLYFGLDILYNAGPRQILQTGPIVHDAGSNLTSFLGSWLNSSSPLGSSGAAVAAWAREKVGNEDYQVLDAHREILGFKGHHLFGVGATKCNAFAWDALVAGGIPPERIPDENKKGGRIPVTADWANPNREIKGYMIVSEPQLGDVVVFDNHMGIYVPLEDGSPGTISASSKESKVVHNNWGFKKGQKPIFRRYIGENYKNLRFLPYRR